MKFLHSYGITSREWLNLAKSHFYTANDSNLFNKIIKGLLDCHRRCNPFNYLGVLIFLGTLRT